MYLQLQRKAMPVTFTQYFTMGVYYCYHLAYGYQRRTPSSCRKTQKSKHAADTFARARDEYVSLQEGSYKIDDGIPIRLNLASLTAKGTVPAPRSESFKFAKAV